MIEQFANEIKQGKPFYKQGALYNIFSWKELENILNLRPMMTTKRFGIIGGENHSWSDTVWLMDTNTFPPSLILDQIKKFTCVIFDSSRVNSTINDIVHQLETLSGLPTDAHIFFSLNPKHSGFDVHMDKSHNLIIQIEGETNFKVWDEMFHDENFTPQDVENIKKKSPSIDVIMKPGDAIYIPAKHFHKAQSLTKRLSISFPMCRYGTFENRQDRTWLKLPI